MDSVGVLDDRRLRTLIDAGRQLVAQLDLSLLLENLLGVAIDITGARYAALDEERRSLERFLARGNDERGRAAIGELPSGRGLLGVLVEDPRPLRLNDLNRDPRAYGFPPGHPSMSSFLGVPILIRGQAWGDLYLTAVLVAALVALARAVVALAFLPARRTQSSSPAAASPQPLRAAA